MSTHGTICGIALGLAVACGGDTPAAGDSPGSGTGSQPSASVAATGRVITVEMYTDAQGNYFKPAKIDANRGDVIRFTLKTGVHNVNFLPDSNPGKQGLPPASEFLQIPDQTWDLMVSLPAGSYYFQCDPHALLGMIGRLEVR